jgi:hypothetical protein
MAAQIFRLDIVKKTLNRLTEKRMGELGLSEPYDLEAWLATCGDELFGREILWIARQDRITHDQRSDLIGVDKIGNLIVAELKRGQADDAAITQALSYAAEYSQTSASELAKTYFETSARTGEGGLVRRAESLEKAQEALSAHVGDAEVNENQILVILAEAFDARALSVCDYLNRATGEARFSIEFWTYAIDLLPGASGTEHLFVLEQILPPPSVRQEIEQKREASKAGKYARDPTRIAFMNELLSFIGDKFSR